MLLVLIVTKLAPAFQHLYHVCFPPSFLPGQKVGQERSLLTSLGRHVDNGLGNMAHLWPCSGGKGARLMVRRTGRNLEPRFKPILVNIWIDQYLTSLDVTKTRKNYLEFCSG